MRALTESVHPTLRTVSRAYSHVRWQKFNITPLRPEVATKLQRDGLDADYFASGRYLPAVPDLARLVAVDVAGAPTLILLVQKRVQRGGVQQLWCKEIAEVQS